MTPDPRLIKVCPECAGPVIRGAKMMVCAHCGWGRVDEKRRAEVAEEVRRTSTPPRRRST